jgi:starch-binding outer membrane protein, SusD/RagB family
MKNVSLSILTISVFFFSSCKKYLQIQPKNYVSDASTIVDEPSALTALNGAYRALGNNGYYGESFVELGFLSGGDWVNLTTGGSANLVIQNFRPDDAYFETVWSAIYAAINGANNILAKVPGIQDPNLTAQLKGQILGQAYFIRALSYFDLARSWGGVPLVLAPTTSATGANAKVSRSTLAVTWEQAESDLDSAYGLLPTTLQSRYVAVQATAVALRARLHLYKQEWAQAEADATTIIGNSGYALASPYSAWLYQSTNPESIFEIEFSSQNTSGISTEMQVPSTGGNYRYGPDQTLVNILTNPTIGGGRSVLVAKQVQAGATTWYGNLYTKITDPVYVLRIAEQYLIRAEARAQQGTNLSGALADLNAVRARAGVALATDASVSGLLLAIENERRVEFALEPFRWFDLARTGRAVPVLNVPAYALLFPIPTTEITLNPNLTQNPGY